MIPINNDSNRLHLLAEQYFQLVEKYLGMYKIKEKGDKLYRLVKGKRTLESRMINYFREHFRQVILAKPEELFSIHEDFKNQLKFKDSNAQHRLKFKGFKLRMGSYYSDFFSKELAYKGVKTNIGRWLTTVLDLRVCPYCNHNYTLTVSDKVGKVNFRPDFDHFYPKSLYPLLALSFYNLIPSCQVCNKLKGSKLVEHSPYQISNNAVKFEIYGINSKNEHALLGIGDQFANLSIKPTYFKNDKPTNCNLETFGIEQVYKHQVDHVQDIVSLAQAYNADHFTGMVENFNGLGKTEEEIDRIIWGAYLHDHSKKPLSKLTNDLLIQLGIKSS